MKEIRNDRLNLRIRPDERDLIEEAAALEGTTISEMLRRLAIVHARKVKKELAA